MRGIGIRMAVPRLSETVPPPAPPDFDVPEYRAIPHQHKRCDRHDHFNPVGRHEPANPPFAKCQSDINAKRVTRESSVLSLPARNEAKGHQSDAEDHDDCDDDRCIHARMAFILGLLILGPRYQPERILWPMVVHKGRILEPSFSRFLAMLQVGQVNTTAADSCHWQDHTRDPWPSSPTLSLSRATLLL